MKKLYILLVVKGMQLTKKNLCYLAEGSTNFIGIRVSFSDEWKGLTKFAVCYRDAREYSYLLDDNDECMIKDSSIVGSDGIFQLKIVGADTGNKITVTTNVVTIKINSNDFSGCESTELKYPTDDFLAQTLAKIKELSDKFGDADLGNGSSTLEIPIATDSVLGVIKVGEGLSITEDGCLKAEKQNIDISGKQDKLSDEQLNNINHDHSRYLTEHQSLQGYARTEDIPQKLSQLENDCHFLTEHQDISGKLDSDSIIVLTQEDYDSLETKSETKFYFIIEQENSI